MVVTTVVASSCLLQDLLENGPSNVRCFAGFFRWVALVEFAAVHEAENPKTQPAMCRV